MSGRDGQRVSIIVLIVAVLLMTIGSHVSAVAQVPVLRIHQVAYPETIDPQKSSFTQEIAVLVANYEGLTRQDENLQTVPAAAEWWESNENASVWTFTLREGLTYSDGSPLTAERFRYAVERTCDPNTAGDYQYVLFDIVGCAEFASLYSADVVTPVAADDTDAYEAARAALGVRVIDDRTLEVTLTHSAPYFPSIAGLWVFFPAQQELIEQGGEDWWMDPANHVGNGPFQITQLEQEQLIAFEVNERYWAGAPKLDGMEFVYVPDGSVALEAYRAGDLHILQPDPSQYPAIEGDPVLSQEMITYPSVSSMMLTFNLRQEPFDDFDVRKAFALAFDRQTFCDVVVNGDCVPSYSWIPQGVPGSIESDMYAYDPEAAREALVASSYGGPENLPEITYSFPSDIPEERPRAEWLAAHYRDVLGVEITLEPVDIQTLVSRWSDPESFPQLSLLGWIQDYADPQNWLSLVWACEGIFAVSTGYCNPEFDALVAEGDQRLEIAERVPFYEDAGRVLLEDLPGVFIFSDANVFLVKPEVTGYDMAPLNVEMPGLFTSLTEITLSE